MKIFSRVCTSIVCLSFLTVTAWNPLQAEIFLEGKVRVSPPWPKPVEISVAEKHQAECGPTKESPKLLIAQDGGLANAVVYVADDMAPSGWKNRAQSYVLDQVRCEFSPHVLLLPPKATLTILNSEDMLHNVRAFDEKAQMLFNDAMPIKGQILKKRFREPGRLVVRCGVHPWMHAIVIVQKHPHYALTDQSGHFHLGSLPGSTVRLHIWHELLGDTTAGAQAGEPFTMVTYPSPDVSRTDKF